MKKIYIAGPYTGGDVAQNVRNAIEAANVLIENGFAPYVPHLSHFQHMLYPQEYEKWMEIDLVWVDTCDALVRLPGLSPGADREVEFATKIGIGVYIGLEDFLVRAPKAWWNED